MDDATLKGLGRMMMQAGVAMLVVVHDNGQVELLAGGEGRTPKRLHVVHALRQLADQLEQDNVAEIAEIKVEP